MKSKILAIMVTLLQELCPRQLKFINRILNEKFMRIRTKVIDVQVLMQMITKPIK